MGLSPDVPFVSEGCDGDLSTQMSMVTDAFTCLGEVLLLMALGRMGTSGVGFCALARETVRGEQDGHQIWIHDHNSYRIQHARAYMKGPSVGKISENFHEQGGPREDGGYTYVTL